MWPPGKGEMGGPEAVINQRGYAAGSGEHSSHPLAALYSSADVTFNLPHVIHFPVGGTLNLSPCCGVSKRVDVGVSNAVDFSVEEGHGDFGMYWRSDCPGDTYYCIFGCCDQCDFSVGCDVLVVQDVVPVELVVPVECGAKDVSYEVPYICG